MAARRKSGMGTIDQLKSGRWRLRGYVDGKQRPIGVYDSRDEAVRAASLFHETERDSRHESDGDSVDKFARKVLTRREVKNEVRDPAKDWSRWTTHMTSDDVGAMAVKRVRAEHLYRWMRRLEDKDLARTTLYACRSLMSVVLDEAVREGLLPANPCRGLKIKGGRKPEPWTFLDVAEQRAILEPLKAPERHIIAISIGAGQRAGELACQRLADVFVDGPEPRMVVRFGTPPSLPTKTGKVRVVPLFGLALAAMREWLELLPVLHPDNPHGLLFPRERGGFRHPDHILRWDEWKAVLEGARIERRFRWHDLRHTCASSLVSGFWGRRWSLQEVKEMLGHTSIAVTQRYAHLAESAIAGAGAETDRLVTESHEPSMFSVVSTPTVDLQNKPLPMLAPPARVERATNALGKPSIGSNGAAIGSSDSSVTSGPVAGPLLSAAQALALLNLPRAAHAALYGGVFREVAP